MTVIRKWWQEAKSERRKWKQEAKKACEVLGSRPLSEGTWLHPTGWLRRLHNSAINIGLMALGSWRNYTPPQPPAIGKNISHFPHAHSKQPELQPPMLRLRHRLLGVKVLRERAGRKVTTQPRIETSPSICLTHSGTCYRDREYVQHAR